MMTRLQAIRPRAIVLIVLVVALAIAAMVVAGAWTRDADAKPKKPPKPTHVARSLVLQADATEISYDLFPVGDSRVVATCNMFGGSVPTSKLLVTAGPSGATVLGDASSTEPQTIAAGQTSEIGWVTGGNENQLTGWSVRIALLDGSGAMASGTAAFLIDPFTDTCSITAQMSG